MSRSRKKHPIHKDRGLTTHEYWSTIRHEWKQTLRTNWEDEDIHLRNPKVIVNDYNYSDWKFWVPKTNPNYRYNKHTDEEWELIYKKILRK